MLDEAKPFETLVDLRKVCDLLSVPDEIDFTPPVRNDDPRRGRSKPLSAVITHAVSCDVNS